MSTEDSEGLAKGISFVVLGLAGVGMVAALLSAAADPRNPTVVRPITVEFGERHKTGERVMLHKAGFAYECVECHAWQERNPEPREFIGEHAAMNLVHGEVDSCFSCHHPDVVDAFRDPDGEPMPYNDHQKLCQRCHGPIYKDWRNGAHGNRAGYWDKSKGETERTDCIICHDPHSPAFKPIKPQPPPGVAVGPELNPSEEPHGTLGILMKRAKEAAAEPPPARAPALPEED